ncbi:TRAP transporter small permease [Oricola thermophila]|uniref:TRAP transporter small permease protein n=1 Tax=Oricola thermophila TaxID=2742145 RepID=A0A6N1VL00_9HYPH|nr:TRAP transporter small permease [Oricola thermophila]QKV20082.1 TRAP transporter small permease [Oricola thermophila]
MLRIMEWLARTLAIVGGLVLAALVLLTCISVIGRGCNTLGHSDFMAEAAPGLAAMLTRLGPVNGDFELVEAGIAFAIFAFLPICQLHGGHATVDIFTNQMPRRLNRFIVVFWEVILTLVLILICWRLHEGLQSKMSNGETTYLLQFPIWWAYAASFFASVCAAIVGVYCAAARVASLVTGKHYLPHTEGAMH